MQQALGIHLRLRYDLRPLLLLLGSASWLSVSAERIITLHAFPAKRRRTSCRQPACKGCKFPTLRWTCQTQSTVGTVLSICTAPRQPGQKQCTQLIHCTSDHYSSPIHFLSGYVWEGCKYCSRGKIPCCSVTVANLETLLTFPDMKKCCQGCMHARAWAMRKVKRSTHLF